MLPRFVRAPVLVTGAVGGLRALALAFSLIGVVSLAAAMAPAPVAADAPALATVAVETTLLAAPVAGAAVLATVPAGTEVVLSGSAAVGFLEATVDDETGWLDARVLEVSDRVGIALAVAVAETPILLAPLPNAESRGTVPAGGVVILTGAEVGAFVAGSYEGTGGWFAEAALGLAYDHDGAAF